MTEYITVRLTVKEAEALLIMAGSGDYQNEDEGMPQIRLPSKRAERKICQALRQHRERTGNKELALKITP